MGDSRRRWSPEFKRDAVALVRSSGRPISDIARELGCGGSSLGDWLTKDRQSRAVADLSGSPPSRPSRRRSSVCAAGWRNWRWNARS